MRAFFSASVFFIVLFISSPVFAQEARALITGAAAGQIDTYSARGTEGPDFLAGDIVRITRAGKAVARAVIISAKGKHYTVTTLGSPSSEPRSGDSVEFESHGRRHQAESQGSAKGGSEAIKREYKWTYKGIDFTCQLETNRDGLMMYKTKPRTYGDYSVYVSDPSDDDAINYLAGIFQGAARDHNFSRMDMVNLVIAFVQSLKYTSDKTTTGYDEYPRYPVETLMDEGGDCEDTSILMSSLLMALGCNTVMIQFPRHMGVGLALKDPSSFSVPYKSRLFTDGSISYAYIETTGEHFQVGQIPEGYGSAEAQVVHLSPKALFRVKDAQYLFNESQCMIKPRITNEGTTSGEVTVHVAMECEGSAKSYSEIRSNPLSVPQGQGVTGSLVVNKPPSGTKCRIIITVYGGNQRTDMMKTEWFNVP
ncbi:MAG: hypothetical protein RDV48_27005 [Candidatus Eremiobacteraeota bacterium]|nr:hypothetical protein [Candidatus Eremiobacteraeota bacterium]